MLHPLVRWLSRRCLRWLYRDIHVVGADRLPATGPVILVMNHGNDLPDVLVGLLTSRRDVRFVATVSAAESRLGDWTYRGLGVIRVTRIKDARRLKARGADAAAMNSAAFEQVSESLREGGIVGIFPEGGVSNTPSLSHFKGGMAKMALKALDSGAISGIQVVPLGFQYEAADCIRSDVVAVVGEVLDLDAWQPRGIGSRQQELTHELFRRLEAVTRNAPSAEARRTLDHTLAAVAAQECLRSELPLDAAERVRQYLTDAPTPTGEPADREAPARALSEHRVRLEQSVAAMGEWIRRAGAHAHSATDHAVVRDAADIAGPLDGLTSRSRMLLLAPVAAIGWIVHAIPFGIAIALADKLAIGPSERAARLILPGLFVVLGWYAIVAISLLTVGGVPWLLLIVLVPRLGDAAVLWRDDLVAWRLVRRVRRWTPEQRDALRSSSAELRMRWRDFVSALAACRRTSDINTSDVPVSSASNTVSHTASHTVHRGDTAVAPESAPPASGISA